MNTPDHALTYQTILSQRAALLQNVGILQRPKVFNILTVVKVNDSKKTVWRCVGECCGGAAPLFVFGFRIGPFIAKQWVTQQLVSSVKITAKQRFGEDQKGWRDGEKEERMMAEAKRWQNTFFFVIFLFFLGWALRQLLALMIWYMIDDDVAMMRVDVLQNRIDTFLLLTVCPCA